MGPHKYGKKDKYINKVNKCHSCISFISTICYIPFTLYPAQIYDIAQISDA